LGLSWRVWVCNADRNVSAPQPGALIEPTGEPSEQLWLKLGIDKFGQKLEAYAGISAAAYAALLFPRAAPLP